MFKLRDSLPIAFRDTKFGALPRSVNYTHMVYKIADEFFLILNAPPPNASVNFTCAQPPWADPRHLHFFCLGWQIAGGGDS